MAEVRRRHCCYGDVRTSKVRYYYVNNGRVTMSLTSYLIICLLIIDRDGSIDKFSDVFEAYGRFAEIILAEINGRRGVQQYEFTAVDMFF